MFLYGPAHLGKTFLAKGLIASEAFKVYVDCSHFVNHLGSVENVQILEEYLTMQYQRSVAHKDFKSVFILDNVNCICPMLSKDQQPSLVDTIKSERFA